MSISLLQKRMQMKAYSTIIVKWQPKGRSLNDGGFAFALFSNATIRECWIHVCVCVVFFPMVVLYVWTVWPCSWHDPLKWKWQFVKVLHLNCTLDLHQLRIRAEWCVRQFTFMICQSPVVGQCLVPWLFCNAPLSRQFLPHSFVFITLYPHHPNVPLYPSS